MKNKTQIIWAFDDIQKTVEDKQNLKAQCFYNSILIGQVTFSKRELEDNGKYVIALYFPSEGGASAHALRKNTRDEAMNLVEKKWQIFLRKLNGDVHPTILRERISVSKKKKAQAVSELERVTKRMAQKEKEAKRMEYEAFKKTNSQIVTQEVMKGVIMANEAGIILKTINFIKDGK